MEREEVLAEMAKGRNCSQIVCGAFADETGYDEEETDRAAAFFGGGMKMGQTCGAVSGGLMALGLMGESLETAQKFEELFKERFGSCVCYELLGNQMPAEAKATGKNLEVCPGYIAGAIEIIEELIS